MWAITPFSTWSKLLGVLHIGTAVTAFGATFAYPAMRRAGATAEIARLHMRSTVPALVLMWVFGMGLAGMSKPDGADDPIYHLSQTWLVLAIVDWLVVLAAAWFLIRPAINDQSQPAHAKFSAGVGVTHLGLAVGLVLMIWKPGL